jgi:hypothetical protein
MNYRQSKDIQDKYKQKLLELFPNIPYTSGIYVLTRKEGDFKYAYIGQAMRILDRLSQHMVGYQHIDLSLKKRGLYSKDNPLGWKVACKEYPLSQLNAMEQEYIKYYANNGYQLYNHTTGSQGEGKQALGEGKSTKGYREGLEQGRKNLAKELKHIIDTHLTITLNIQKQGNKVSQKALDKFWRLLEETENNNE